MSAAIAHVLLGLAAGFLVWFPLGWLTKRDELWVRCDRPHVHTISAVARPGRELPAGRAGAR